MTEVLRPKDQSEKEIFAVEELIFNVQYEIQKLLSSRDLTQKDLAERLGCSPARVSQMLNDKGGNMTLETVARALFALEAKCNFPKAIMDQRKNRTNPHAARSAARAEHDYAQISALWAYSLTVEHEGSPPKQTGEFAQILSRKDRGFFIEAANQNERVNATKRRTSRAA